MFLNFQYIYVSKQFLDMFYAANSWLPCGTDLTFISDFSKFLAIPTTPFTHTPPKILDYRQQGHIHEKCHGTVFLTENKKLEESLAGSIKRIQVVYTALFSCQERRLWKWHAFHRKLWDSRAFLAPRRHTEILGVVHQPRNDYLPNHSFKNINWFFSLF